jgi:hypothetical protein
MLSPLETRRFRNYLRDANNDTKIVAEKMGVSRKTVYNWIHRLEQEEKALTKIGIHEERGTCATCHWWCATPAETVYPTPTGGEFVAVVEEYGECRAGPPTAGNHCRGRWPVSHKTEWCRLHEWEAIP